MGPRASASGTFHTTPPWRNWVSPSSQSGGASDSDGTASNESDLAPQRSGGALCWMSGRDAVSLKLECKFDWLAIVKPSLQDIFGLDWELKVHPEDLEACKRVLADVVAHNRPFQIEYRLEVSPQCYTWLTDFGKPWLSLSSRPEFLGYVGWRKDINKRKSIECDYEQYWTLQEEILFKSLPGGQYFENISPSLPRKLGYTVEEFLKIKWSESLHPDDIEKTSKEFLGAVASNLNVACVENRYRCKPGFKLCTYVGQADGPVHVDSTGSYIWISWTAKLCSNYLYGAGRDISAQKKAELELKQSQAELRRIAKSIPGGVFQYSCDENGVDSFPYVSKGTLALCNSDQDEKLIHSEDVDDSGMESSIADYSVRVADDQDCPIRAGMLSVRPEKLPILREAMRGSLARLSSWDCDYRMLKYGKVRWVRVHAVPQLQGQGKAGLKTWCGIAWDITDGILEEESLRQARDAAEKASEAKGRFLANMSHEIRTPMNAVIGMGALLLQTELNEEQREYACTIRSSGEALLTLINDILDFSKIEAGKMDLEISPFSLTDCIEDSLDLVAPQAAVKGLELSYLVAEKVPLVITGDVSRIRQILVNLLSNAVRFTANGQISITVDGRILASDSSTLTSVLSSSSNHEPRGGDGEAELGSNSAPEGAISSSIGGLAGRVCNWEVQISVKDSGVGIPADRVHSLFQAFSQVDTSTTRKYEGTGLGLAICSRLCTLWGGRIWVEPPIIGRGSTFHFTVIGQEIAMEKPRPIEEEKYMLSLRKRRILIIGGGSSSGQAMCCRFLKSWNLRAVSATTADEASHFIHHAVEKTASDPLLAVIIDSAMIEKENQKTLECLRFCQASTPKIPIILLTSYGQQMHEYVKGLNIDFWAHVSKPIKSSQLLNAILKLSEEFQNALSIESESQGGGTSNLATQKPKTLTNLRSTNGRNSCVAMDTKTSERYPLKILVGEDNTINQKVILRLLQKHGYIVDMVSNGLEAVDAASRTSYDVILMDCFMPEMDGLEATTRIRQRIRPCPVIVAVTAAALEEERGACASAGMHMYVSKPIKSEALTSTLYKCWQVKIKKLPLNLLQSPSPAQALDLDDDNDI